MTLTIKGKYYDMVPVKFHLQRPSKDAAVAAALKLRDAGYRVEVHEKGPQNFNVLSTGKMDSVLPPGILMAKDAVKFVSLGGKVEYFPRG